MREIIFLEPVFKELIWGGNRLHTHFGYNIPSDSTGECWGISAHSNGDCVVKNGIYKGKKLSSLWDKNRELFGNIEGDLFPLLAKIIDAKKNLSIQVHPDNSYADKFENGSLGKSECWYILDCDEDSTIVLGHNANTKEELIEFVENGKWNDLLRKVPVKKGDFFQISPGTIHAINGGVLILEIQQNSDITYRLYDYDRLTNGKPRELHYKQCIDVIQCPYVDSNIKKKETILNNCIVENLISHKYYTVNHVDLEGVETFAQREVFTLISIIDGSGTIDGINIAKGDHFILPAEYGDYEIQGKLSYIHSHI